MQLIPSGDDLLLFNGIQLLAKVEGDRIVDHPEYLAAYPGTLNIWEGISQVGGRWPDAGWIEVTRAAARTSYSILYEKNGNQWRKIDQTQEAEGYRGIQEWDRGRRIALVSRSFEPSYYWEIVRGNPRIPPKHKKFNACTTGECGDSTATGIVPSDFAALPTGNLFAVGALHNEENRSGWAVERWEPNHVNSKVDILPTPSEPTLQPMVEGITAFAPNDAYVFGKLDRFIEGSDHMAEENVGAYLVHFDGDNWNIVPFPSNAGVRSISTSDGVLWATSGGSLWKKSNSQSAWETIVLPTIPAALAQARGESLHDPAAIWRLAASRVLARSGGDVWVESVIVRDGEKTCEGQSVVVIFRNRPHPEVWHSLEGEKQAQAIEKYQPLHAATESCDSIFVLLYGMTRTTPKNYDYPLTRAALKGHTEFGKVTFAETVDRGEHYFGAFVPDFDQGQRLVAVIRRKVKDSKPIMLCRHPKKVRLLEFDLATGAVTKNAKVDE